MELVAQQPVAMAAIPWRFGDAWRLTVVVKGTFQLRHGQAAKILDGLPLFRDLHFEDNVQRSLLVASDMALRKPRADVLFLGSGYAHGETVVRHAVRLAIRRNQTILLDKSLFLTGDRRRDPSTGRKSAPAPFSVLPLRYELAYGGRSSGENPVGMGADADDPRVPNIGDARGHPGVAGFGAIAATWPARGTRLRGAGAPGPRPEIARDFDFGYFNAAPIDQQVPYLAGDEEILLSNLHPTIAEFSGRLARLRAHALLEVDLGKPSMESVKLVADTLWIDGDALQCCVTWRGDVEVHPLVAEARARTRIVATLHPPDRTVSMPKVTFAQVGLPSPPPPMPFAGTLAPSSSVKRLRDAYAQLQSVTRRDAPADAGLSSAEPTPAPPAWIGREEAERSPPAPDAPAPAPPEGVTSVVAPPPAVAPPPPPQVAGAPVRTTESVPILNATGLEAFTLAWQLRPPVDALVVVVKGTFAVGADGSVVLADAQLPPSGDVYFDDDPTGSLSYPSDFAPFKPRADVMLVGHAFPSGEQRNVALVELRLGALTKSLVVFGDRPSDASKGGPAAFDKMPLRFERARGGPRSEHNPVGRGFGSPLAPNLEHRDVVAGRADDSAPACLAPVAPSWRARASKLGTYDAGWLKARWPYFPEDFDWGYFNAAPPSLQVPHLTGDEPFSLAGVAPGGAVLSGRLPGARPRVFALQTKEAGGRFLELTLRLDTAWFDADARRIVLCWRGMIETTDEDAPELAYLYVMRDTPGAG
jgi:hypothetical protein